MKAQKAPRVLCWFFVASWLSSLPLRAADGTNANALVGCYRVASLSSKPANALTGGLPQYFELTTQTTIFGHGWLQMISPTATTAPAHLHHLWHPRGDGISVQFGWGLGGWKGTLRPSGSNEFSGKLRPFCDSGCGSKQIVTIRITRNACSKETVSER